VLLGERCNELAHGPAFAASTLFQPAGYAPNAHPTTLGLPKAFGTDARSEQQLPLSIHGKNGRLAGLLQLANVTPGVTLEIAQ